MISTTENAGLRLANDIGGTFTDTVLAGPDGAVLASTKTLTTHDDPSRAALEGVARVMAAAGRDIGEVSGFVHGTTLATNALIERRGAKVASITTEGFRDILEIAYERRYAQYDINLQKPAHLVAPGLTLTVRERVDAGGRVLTPLDDAQTARVVDAVRDCGAEAVAICLLHAYANPAHERALRDALGVALPGVAVSISSGVSPEAREYDRLSTTVANAYIQPLMDSYLDRFARAFAGRGLRCPVLMMTAGGGMCALDTARAFPIRLVESGPAGGAILAARIAAELDEREVISFDMGGTTAKLCLIDGQTPQTARSFEIARAARFIKGSGMPVRIPVIEMIEIGAGGGSIAGVDRLGRLTVGPLSAGSDPGPAGFGRGGTRATVTDGDLVQGFIRPDLFAEGQFAPSRLAAEGAVAADIGAPLGLPPDKAAQGISRIVDDNMGSAARMHGVESGKDLRARTMIAFGGNGPLHATRLARACGVQRIVIPPDPGVGSAVGFLHAPVSFEIVRSRYGLLETLDFAATAAMFADMQAEALAVVEQGAPGVAAQVTRSAFMRYHGQGHEIEITLPEADLTPDDLPGVIAAFEAAYQAQFSRPVPGMSIEVLNWALRAATPPAKASPAAPTATAGAAPTSQTVPILCDVTGQWVDAPLIMRDALPHGHPVKGPALIAEAQTTTLVSAGFTAQADGQGNLILTRDETSREERT